MNTYKITFQLLSPVITPFHADTVFGHYCWALRYLRGETSLAEFLKEMKSEPPVLFSDGFPEEFLPRPVIAPLTVEQEGKLQDIFRDIGGDNLSFVNSMKTLKKVPVIAESTFVGIMDSYDDSALYEKVFRGEICSRDFGPKSDLCADRDEPCLQLTEKRGSHCKKPLVSVSDIVSHNTINRISDTTGTSGGFFQQEESFYAQNQNFVVFLKCGESRWSEVREVFSEIEWSGFGKDKSTGKGQVKIVSSEKTALPDCNVPNAVMSLSSMIPSADDAVDARYSLMTKYGKLGGDYAKSAYSPGSPLIPFKKPLIMMKAGAVFSLKNGQRKEFLGCMMNNVHHHPDIVHYAYGFPLYFKTKS
ncbi:hypothetical protein ACFL6I_08540 [candidate division KSB1 bacterium]